MKTDKEFINSIENNIKEKRAIDKLISDHAQTTVSNCVKDILYVLFINDWQSEPH